MMKEKIRSDDLTSTSIKKVIAQLRRGEKTTKGREVGDATKTSTNRGGANEHVTRKEKECSTSGRRK